MPAEGLTARRDMLLLMAGNLTQYLTAIISIKLMTSLLSPGEMGRVAIITAIALWFNVLYNGVGAYVQRNILAWGWAGKAVQYVRYLVYYLLTISGLGTALLFLLHGWVGIGIDIAPEWLVTLMLGLTFFSYLNTGVVGWINLLGKRGWFVFFSIATLWSGLAISAYLCISGGGTAENWLFGQVAGQVAVLAFSSFVFISRIRRTAVDGAGPAPAGQPLSPSRIFHFAWPMSVASLLLWLQQSAYRFILGAEAGLEVVGLVSVGFGLGVNFMNRFEILFNQFYHPVFYREISSGGGERRVDAWNSYAYFLIPPALLLSVFIVAGGPFLARIFVGNDFFAATKTMIAWGVATQFILIVMTIYSMAGIIEQKTTDFILPNLIGAAVMAILLLSLVSWDPFAGSGLALAGGAMASLLVMRLKMKKLMPIRFPLRRSLLSAVISVPLAAGLWTYSWAVPFPGIIESLLVLALAGAYTSLAGMMLLGKRLSLPGRFAALSVAGDKLESMLPFQARPV